MYSFALQISGILTAPSLSTALYCTGADGGIVIDVGYRETHVLVVAHGRLLIETYQGGQNKHKSLAITNSTDLRVLMLRTVIGVGSAHVVRRFQDMIGAEEAMTERQAEDLVVRTGFVMSLVPDQRPVSLLKHRSPWCRTDR